MDLDKAVELFLEANTVTRADFDTFRDEFRQEMVEMRKDLSESGKSITHFPLHTETLLGVLTRGQLGLQEATERLKQQVEQLEKRIPPAA